MPKPAPAPGGADVLASGLKWLVASQVATRAVTFILSTLLTRKLTAATYGVATVQFYLINITILMLAREGVRRGCITGGAASPARVLLATGALAPAAALPLAALVACIAGRGVAPGSPRATALRLQIAAALVEVAAEPLFCLAAARGRLRPRVVGEAGGTLVRGVVGLALLSRGGWEAEVALSVAQLAYSFTWLLGHVVEFVPDALAARAAAAARARSPPRRRSARRAPPPLLDRTTLALVAGFTVQAAEKLVLAEGSKAVLAASATAAAQGAYGLAANVGSLAVRTLFAPIEEAAFYAFARRGPPADAGRLLAALTRAVTLVGAAGAALGPPLAFAFVRGAYGERWACATAAPAALAAYAAYTALLAANGVLEAFVHARGGPKELAAGNGALCAIAAAGAAAAAAGARAAGAPGLVAADAGGMVLRIAWSLGAVRRLLGKDAPRVAHLVPSASALGGLAAAAAVATLSDRFFLGARCAPDAPPFWRAAGAHVAVSGAAAVAAAAVAWRGEKDAVGRVLALRHKKQD